MKKLLILTLSVLIVLTYGFTGTVLALAPEEGEPVSGTETSEEGKPGSGAEASTGKTEYETLEEAIKACEPGGTIEGLKDCRIDGEDKVLFEKDVTITNNTYSLSNGGLRVLGSTGYCSVEEGADLIISDNHKSGIWIDNAAGQMIMNAGLAINNGRGGELCPYGGGVNNLVLSDDGQLITGWFYDGFVASANEAKKVNDEPDIPEEPEIVEIPDEEIPIAYTDEEKIIDGEVPKTGNERSLPVMAGLMTVSAAGLFTAVWSLRRKEK